LRKKRVKTVNNNGEYVCIHGSNKNTSIQLEIQCDPSVMKNTEYNLINSVSILLDDIVSSLQHFKFHHCALTSQH